MLPGTALLVAALLGGEVLTPSAPVRGAIDAASPVVESPGLTGELVDVAPARGVAVEFAPVYGTWTLELRSEDFDAYLVVRDAEGEPVGEDDDGLGGTNARVVFRCEADGTRFTVLACALHGGTGAFELRAVTRVGVPDVAGERSPAAFVQRVRAELGQGRAAFEQLLARGNVLSRESREREAVALLQEAIATEDTALEDGAYHVALYRSALAGALLGMKRYLESARAGGRALPLLRARPDDEDQAVSTAFNLARALMYLDRAEEGLEPARFAAPRIVASYGEGTPPARAARTLLLTLLRWNGLWEEALAEVGEPRLVRDGDTLEGEVVASELYQRTAVVDMVYSDRRAGFETLPVRVEESGYYTLDLRSYFFDAYLVVRDALGEVLAEDDDSRGVRDARVVTWLEAGETYLLEPTALHGKIGRYRLDVIAGEPPTLSARERRAERLEEARECVGFAREGEGLTVIERILAFDRAAVILTELGRRDEIVALREQELAMRREAYSEGSMPELEGRLDLCEALVDAGRASEAVGRLEDLLARYAERHDDIGGRSGVLWLLARARRARGDYERAARIYDELERSIVAETGESPDDRLDLLQERLAIARSRGDVPRAADLARRVVDWYRERGFAERPGGYGYLAYALLAQAQLQWRLEGPEPVLGTLREAVRLKELELGELGIETADVRGRLALALARLGRGEAAREQWSLVEQAFEGRDPRGLDPDLVRWGAEVALADGAVDEAYERASQALEVGIERRRGYLATLPEPLKLRALATSRLAVGVVLACLGDDGARRRGVYERVLALKGMVGRGLVQSRAQALASLDEDTRALVDELRAVQSRLSAVFHSGDAKEADELRALRVELEEELALAQGAAGGGGATVAELARALPAGSALVDFCVNPRWGPPAEEGGADGLDWTGRRRVLAWVLRAGSEDVALVDLGPADALQRAMRRPGGELLAMRGVGVGARPAGGAADEDELSRLLWAPLAPHVGDAARVFVSTEGFLGTVPLEVLKDEDGAYLIEDRAFVYVADASELVDRGATPARAVEDARLLLVGDVDYGERADAPDASLLASTLRSAVASAWAPLPFTRRETERVAALFEDAGGAGEEVLLEGAGATEEAVKAALPGSTYVHVASHGFFEPEGTVSQWSGRGAEELEDVAGLFPGLLSGLVLAGANAPVAEGREDGLLTAEELTWLDLSACELVTLSACETGLGAARSGEGLIGLRRAFHLAGARTVIASLWAVEDEATSRLMASFYRYLWVDGLPRGDALRAAQLDLLRANRATLGRARPETWGAFVLSGDWR